MKSARQRRSTESLTDSLLLASQPLLELFATADDVFSEENAFDPEKLRPGLGRLYRSWKEARKMIDPSFDPHRWTHNTRGRSSAE